MFSLSKSSLSAIGAALALLSCSHSVGTLAVKVALEKKASKGRTAKTLFGLASIASAAALNPHVAGQLTRSAAPAQSLQAISGVATLERPMFSDEQEDHVQVLGSRSANFLKNLVAPSPRASKWLEEQEAERRKQLVEQETIVLNREDEVVVPNRWRRDPNQWKRSADQWRQPQRGNIAATTTHLRGSTPRMSSMGDGNDDEYDYDGEDCIDEQECELPPNARWILEDAFNIDPSDPDLRQARDKLEQDHENRRGVYSEESPYAHEVERDIGGDKGLDERALLAQRTDAALRDEMRMRANRPGGDEWSNVDYASKGDVLGTTDRYILERMAKGDGWNTGMADQDAVQKKKVLMKQRGQVEKVLDLDRHRGITLDTVPLDELLLIVRDLKMRAGHIDLRMSNQDLVKFLDDHIREMRTNTMFFAYHGLTYFNSLLKALKRREIILKRMKGRHAICQKFEEIGATYNFQSEEERWDFNAKKARAYQKLGDIERVLRRAEMDLSELYSKLSSTYLADPNNIDSEHLIELLTVDKYRNIMTNEAVDEPCLPLNADGDCEDKTEALEVLNELDEMAVEDAQLEQQPDDEEGHDWENPKWWS